MFGIDRDPLVSFSTVFPKQLPNLVTRVLHLHRQLQTFERAPVARQNQLLKGQLDNLLLHAKRYAPFWAERMANCRLQGRSLEQTLKDVQPLTRKDLQSEFERLSAKFPKREALGVIEGSSSGSTGTPVRFERCSRLYTPLYFAVGYLCSRWHSIDQQKPLGVIGNRNKDKDSAPLGVPYRWLGPVATGFERSTKDREISETYDYCARKNPAYLQCGPTTLSALARYAIENGRNELRPEKALTLGSAVTDETREIVLKGLGAKIVDRYSCEETGYIALQCPNHDHFHVISPVTMVEIVDDDGKPCPPGKPGRVLLTNMQSYAMPLIRYEIGDMAEWGEPCDCGITLPVISKIWGRTRHLITTPDGRKVYLRVYARDLQDIAGLIEYRFVLHQNAVVVAHLRVSEPSASIAAAVTEKVQRALGYPYPVRVQFVEKIDWGASWKQEAFAVSDAPAPSEEALASSGRGSGVRALQGAEPR
jgi:phenylacetate-CoA ligase